MRPGSSTQRAGKQRSRAPVPQSGARPPSARGRRIIRAAPCPTAEAKSDSPPGGRERGAPAGRPQVLIEIPGMRKRILHRLLGDLVEGDALNFLFFGQI